jgi:acetylornithine/N-succinyldiaminopimelate aminotransferase
MDSTKIKFLEDTYTADTYARYDLALVKGEGVRAYDPEGNKYLDFTSGIGVNTLGFSDPGWAEVVAKQAASIQHTSNLFYTEPCGTAAELMMRMSDMSNMFFCNSGAEANEGAIKAARKYSQLVHDYESNGEQYPRYEIITLSGSFHGRTMATITATGQESFHKDFSPFLQGFVYAAPNDIADLESKISDKTCAIMIELVQGEGGVIVLDKEYVKAVSEICAKKDILLIADEVQTGVGRTGEFMAYDHYDIKPDLVTVAKGLGGGLPIGAILFGDKTKAVLGRGDHGSTFGGNPVVCAGAAYVLSQINGEFLAEVRANGEYLKEKLRAMKGVSGVSGIGLMVGVSLETGTAADIVKKCMKNGLLVLTAKDKIRMLPPLIISREAIDEGLEIFERVLAE